MFEWRRQWVLRDGKERWRSLVPVWGEDGILKNVLFTGESISIPAKSVFGVDAVIPM